MNIEEFYDADPRRRPSAEVELGTEWTDTHGVRFEVNWIADTGELYFMREPVEPEWEDPLGGMYLDRLPIDSLAVAVIAQIPTHDQLEKVLRGWEEEISKPDSVSWLAGRIREAGVAVAGG
jgi:hypothetical protein